MNNGNARLGILVAVIVIIALVAGTWFVGIAPRLAEAAAADEERAGIERVNVGHEATLARLRLLNDDLPALRTELDGLRIAYPSDAAFPAYFREIEALGAASGVAVSVVGFDGPDVYEPLAEAAFSNPELQAALGSVSPSNFMTLSVTIQIDGAYGGVMDAIARLQSTGRYVLIHDVQLPNGFNADDPAASALVTGQMFVLRDSAPAPEASE